MIQKQENLKAYHLILIYVKQWLHGSRFGIVPQYSLESSLMLYLMDEYTWRRITKGRDGATWMLEAPKLILGPFYYSNQCKNKTLCNEKLSLVLPETPPYVPRQFASCAVIGNSGDLLKTRFGQEIDGYDAVVRENGAPIQNTWARKVHFASLIEAQLKLLIRLQNYMFWHMPGKEVSFLVPDVNILKKGFLLPSQID